jgi:CubicO group peptidase (beta-lactamase class C family)
MPLARFATWIAAYEPAFPAGSSESYSNSGYNLLALIVERVSGQGIGAFLETEVLAPASLRATGTMTDSPPAGIPAGLTPAPAPALLDAPAPLHPSWLLGSGSIYASADDVACWGEEVARRMTSGDGWLPYGWGVRGVGRERHFEQNGRIPGYAAVLQVYPSAELVVVVLSRVESDAVMRIAAGVAASALGKAVASEPLRAAAPLTREDQRSYEGVYDIAPGFSLTVGPFRGGLGVAVGVGESLQYGVLQPLGEDRFFFREAYVEVRFERNVDGSVTGILWSGTGPYPRRRPAATAE